MKAILEYSLPEEEPEHSYALAGIDALILIEDLCNEIRSKLRYDSGEFREFPTDEWDEETNQFKKITVKGDDHTLEKVWQWVIDQKQHRNLPELI
jgi:glutathione peroxidase-family protein